MPTPQDKTVVEAWLDAEIAETPHDPVLAAIHSCTADTKLDEGSLLTKLRQLCQPLPEPEEPIVDD